MHECALWVSPQLLRNVTNDIPWIYQFAGLMCFSQDTCALDRLPPEELSPFLNSDLFCRQRRPRFQVASAGASPHAANSRLCSVTQLRGGVQAGARWEVLPHALRCLRGPQVPQARLQIQRHPLWRDATWLQQPDPACEPRSSLPDDL